VPSRRHGIWPVSASWYMVRSGTPMIAAASLTRSNRRGSCSVSLIVSSLIVGPTTSRPPVAHATRQERTSLRPPERMTGGGPTRTVTGERDGQRAATGLVRSTRRRVTLLSPRARRRP
jgi:hypothetical protein